jgi:hypothetical protein
VIQADLERFLSAGGKPQKRYEQLREAVEQYPNEEWQVAERWEEEKKCFAQRLKRYGLLGLLDADPAGSRWRTLFLERSTRSFWNVEVVAVDRRDTEQRWFAAYSLLWAKAQEELGTTYRRETA